jgi:hypothetical protein
MRNRLFARSFCKLFTVFTLLVGCLSLSSPAFSASDCDALNEEASSAAALYQRIAMQCMSIMMMGGSCGGSLESARAYFQAAKDAADICRQS